MPINMGKVPKHVARLVWEHYCGPTWKAKCYVKWCGNVMHCMSSDWHVGHNIPESKGGLTTVQNLRPICSDCNLGMGSRLTIDKWTSLYRPRTEGETIAINVLMSRFQRKRGRAWSCPDDRRSKKQKRE